VSRELESPIGLAKERLEGRECKSTAGCGVGRVKAHGPAIAISIQRPPEIKQHHISILMKS